MTTPALVVAHPGHELMVFHWMERNLPLYFCLTDGSGGDGDPRLRSTERLLAAAGASPGPLFGRYPDKELYRLLLAGQVDEFVGLASELAEILIGAGVDCVVGDAAEGFNPAHDVCRLLIDGAVAQIRRHTGTVVSNYEFALESPAESCPASVRADAVWLRLDEAALDRKLRAALEYEELREEVTAALKRFGRAAFAVECLRPVTTQMMLVRFESEPPFYERGGQMRVDQGVYREVIRYREHVSRVLAALAKADARQ